MQSNLAYWRHAHGWSRLTLTLCVGALFLSCGGRTDLRRTVDSGPPLDARTPSPETCSGLDEDLDGRVDEGFRDEDGRYIQNSHCGGCGVPCTSSPFALSVACEVHAGAAICAATQCEDGYTVSHTGRCVSVSERLCLACIEDSECGDFEGARCASIGSESRCAIDCALGCPDGYSCMDEVCVPAGGSCNCDPGDTFGLACAATDPEGEHCAGQAQCSNGVLSMCLLPPEVCDEMDDDCDGTVDEGFVDAQGNYTVDLHNCGRCGVDCTESAVPGVELTCGGDPFAATCVLRCPDADDGIQPGDRIDADRTIASGCECTVTSTSDVPGPLRTSGAALDPNCDGADGEVIHSVYVAADGNDAWPGSPTRPLRTIGAAVTLAAASRMSGNPRPHIFVASGSYAETVTLAEGVQIHGGYRRDFLSLDPDGFRVEIRAPRESLAPAGAALVARDVGVDAATGIEWVALIGRDAAMMSSPAFGAFVHSPGRLLFLREMEVRAGSAGGGANGAVGPAGAEASSSAQTGAVPRAAQESASRECLNNAANQVAGGQGGTNQCAGIEASGGAGGGAGCPSFEGTQGTGSAGLGNGGAGGRGGQDSRGPISGPGCPGAAVCCGLADFSVPTDFVGPQPGENGRSGRSGTSGQGCSMPFGTLTPDGVWMATMATGGSAGSAGGGGGGGGAGGGTEMDFMRGVCEFADGLGGGGGGGGAGGCGGGAGTPGTSGAPSVALVVANPRGVSFEIRDVRFHSGAGGRGGDGGAGGDGGRGRAGALGGELARALRSSPTLAGPFGGARGGRGGDGGSGGGGGGGCGGGSVGIWVTGEGASSADEWRAANRFELGEPGLGGRGGAGASPGTEGQAGGASDVVVR